MISKSTLKSAASSFWKGATEPSLGTIIGIAGLVIFQIVALCWYWTPERMTQINPSWVPNTVGNQNAYTSLIATRLKYLPSTHKGIILVGTSSVRNSIQNFDHVGLQLSSGTGLPTKFYMLSTPGQTLWESGMILDFLPTQYHGVVILSISLSRLSWGRDTLENYYKTPKLALNSAFLFNETKLAGIAIRKHSGIFLMDHRNLFFKFGLILAKAVIGWHPKNLHFNSKYGQNPNTEKNWKNYRKQLNNDKKLFTENSAYNLDVLSRIIRQLKDKDIPVILLESTLHPRAYEIMGSEYFQYRQKIEEFANRQNVPYWNLNKEAKLSAADFMDFSHMSNPNARKRYQQVFVQHLAELINQELFTLDLK